MIALFISRARIEDYDDTGKPRVVVSHLMDLMSKVKHEEEG